MHTFIEEVIASTGTTYDLTTVDDVNAALGLTSNTANDAATAAQITQTSKVISELCDRVFAMQTVRQVWRISFYEIGTQALWCLRWPVISLTSLTIADQEVDPTCYEIDADAGLIWTRRAFWHWWGQWHGEIAATYTGGYELPEGAPALLEQACIETMRSQRAVGTRDPTLRSTTHGDTTVSYSDYYSRFRVSGDVSAVGGSALPPNADAMIQSFKRIAI